MKKLMSLFVLISFLSSTALFGQVRFQYCDFDYAKKAAVNNQKPFFVFFTANDCASCWDINHKTFKDADLATAVGGNYNAYKVDIRSKTGDLWATKFAVYKAPVFLFFDKDGNMMQRVEEPLTAANFQRILEDPSAYHEIKTEFVGLKEAPVSNENMTDSYSETSVDAPVENYASSESTTTFENATVFESESESTADYSGVSEMTVPASETTVGAYAVQTGIFTNENYAKRMAKDLSSNYTYSINVRTEIIDGKTFHRVLLGDFTNMESAKSAYQILKGDGRAAFVKAK